MNIRKTFDNNRILILAVGFSVVLHIFWITTLKVRAAPKDARPIRFSRVSFLGPFVGKGIFKVGIGPRERTFLEERYISAIKTKIRTGNITKDDSRVLPTEEEPVSPETSYQVSGMMGEVKLEPGP